MQIALNINHMFASLQVLFYLVQMPEKISITYNILFFHSKNSSDGIKPFPSRFPKYENFNYSFS